MGDEVEAVDVRTWQVWNLLMMTNHDMWKV